MDIATLPKLTPKENSCVLNFFTCCMGNKIQSYKKAYDCENSNENTIYKEACKFFKNPKITPWLEYYEQSLQEYNENEIKYTRKEFMDELDRIRAKTEDNQKTVGIALKAVELKGKASGLLKDNLELSGGTTVQMGCVEVGGKQMEFNIGVNKVGNEINPATPSADRVAVTTPAAALSVKGVNKNNATNTNESSGNIKPASENASDDIGVQ